MHIAMMCSNFPPHTGGLEAVVQNLVRGLAARHRVTVVTSAWQGQSGVDREGGVEVHRLPAVHWSEQRGVPYPVPVGPGLRRAMTAIRTADVFHAHGALYATSLIATLAAGRARRPLVLTEHVGFVHYRSPILNLLQRLAWGTIGDAVVRRAAAVVGLNSRVLAWLRTRHARLELRFIGNGVDALRFRPRLPGEIAGLRRSFGLPQDETLAVFVGRAAEKKNLELLLRLPHQGYRLVTCGAAGRTVPDGVIDLGVVPFPRMPDLLGCVDLMVLPSMGEGFPVAAQEAMAAGVPLVLLWDDGYADWLRKDVVAACAGVADISPTIARLVANSPVRARLAAAQRNWACEHWSWEKTTSMYEDLYVEVLARSGGPGSQELLGNSAH